MEGNYSIGLDTICFVLYLLLLLLFCGGVFLIRPHQKKHLNIVMN